MSATKTDTTNATATTEANSRMIDAGVPPAPPETHHKAGGKQQFAIGQVYATPGAIESGVNLLGLLRRHINGDFGDLCKEDRDANLVAIKEGFRVISSFNTSAGKIWIITESDRSSTTILLPDEY